MTREEEIRNASSGYALWESGAHWADAHPVNPWHKVSEELPEETKYVTDTIQGKREWTESKIVLVIDNHYLPSVDCLKNGEWMTLRTHPRDCDGFPIQYLYWMPIPEPPKVE